MRAFGLAVLLALHTVSADGPAADPAHLRYQRVVVLPVGTSGPACTVLDASVFAHAASRSAEDLRLFASAGGAAEVEMPFVLTENGPVHAETETATVLHRGMRAGAVTFDLAMPQRPYSEIDLAVAGRDFVATAEVSGKNADGSGKRTLGTFTLFDFSGQKLGRSTVLQLAETTLPVLQVTLRFRTPAGGSMRVGPEVILGAKVPPSRQAQTLYTVVAQTAVVVQRGRSTVARLVVPAHVPVERMHVVLDPAFHGNFVREVALQAVPRRRSDAAASETVSGEIVRTAVAPPAGWNAMPIRQQQLSMDAVLAANLRGSAEVTVSIANGDDKPLPVRAVALAMRQRRICFNAQPGSQYVLRYGDAVLPAPAYDFARLFDASSPAADASLGPEYENPQYKPREDTRPYLARHPELLWVALFSMVAILGAAALASVRQHRGHH